MTEEQRDLLCRGLTRLGVPYTPEAVERLGLYCRRLLEKNQVMNLTAITDPADVMTLHFLDSAALLPTRALGGRKLIDVGTGAGFPGLVLRILDPTIRLTLLDSLGKRVEWLTELCRELDLPDVVLLKGRAEELSRRKTHREQYDVAVSRALAAMPMLAELCLPYVKPGGLFLAMKSNKTDEEIAGAEKIIQALGGEKPFVMDYLVPGTEVYHRVSDPSSLRDAQRVVSQLPNLETIHLVVNRVRPRLLRRQGATIDDAMDTAGLPLLGLVPEDAKVVLAASSGRPLAQMSQRGAAKAYENIARRLTGQQVPLMRIR